MPVTERLTDSLLNSMPAMRRMLELSPDAMLIVDYETMQYVGLNEAAVVLTGWNRDELMARGPMAPVGWSADQLRQHYKGLVAQSPAPHTGDSTFTHRDGSALIAELTRRAIQENGRWLILIFARDVSAQRSAQAGLEQFRAMVDQAADSIMLIDSATNRFIDVNETALRTLGFSREAMLAMPSYRVNGEMGDAKAMSEADAALIAMQPAVRVTSESLVRADGTVLPVEVSRRAVHSGGRWIIVLTARDVTERNRDQANLERFRAAIDNAADTLALIDPETSTYVDVNETMCRLLGYTREELTGAPVATVVEAAQTPQEYRAAYDEIIAHYPESLTVERNLRRRDGSLLPLEIVRKAVKFSDGHWIIVVVGRDISERKKAQAHLERFRAALDQSTEAILLIDRESMRYVDCNETACHTYGYSRDELLATPPLKLSGRHSTEAELKAYYDSIIAQSPKATVIDGIMRRRDGMLIHAEITRRALRSEGRWLIVATSRDTSERNKAQAHLERFRTALDQSADAIFLTEREAMRYVDCNERACQLFGYTREELLATPPYKLSGRHDSEAQLAATHDEIIALHPKTLVTEGSMRRRDGVLIPTELTRRALRSDDRWLIVMTARDITERKAAQRKLEWFRLAMDNSADALTLVDRETMSFIDANLEATRRAGFSREEYLALNPWDRIRNCTREELERAYDDLIAASPEVKVIEREFAHPDGTIYPAEIRRTAVRLDGHWIIVAAVRDITDRARAETERKRRMDDLARSNEELERFAYVASHDLSEPLRMISSYANLLNRRYKDKIDEDGQEFLGFIVGGTHRMKQLIDDLLAYSKAGRITKKMVAQDMNAILDDVLANLRQLIDDKHATIERMALPTVICDRTSLTQLLQNLVGNALKFQTDKLPLVRIAVTEDAQGWTFSVADNGIGIAPEYFERIFVVFQRLHTREKYAGTGIGLSICKKIVESHGGRIWLESTPGQGTTFSFSLPRTPPDTVPA